MSNINFRFANKSDIDEISILENSYPYEVYSKVELNSMFNFDYYTFLVAIDDDKIIGYICSTIVYDNCDLLKIIVNKDYRKQGIGKLLLLKLIEVCKEKDVENITLEVRDDNKTAISFYENNGFEQLGERKGYYNGKDAKIYRLHIK